jgi:hypothetical protein
MNYLGNLTLSGGNTKTMTLSAASTIGGNLSIGDGVNFTTAGNFTLGVTGTTTVGGGASGTFTLGGTSAKTFTGDVTINNGATWNNTGNAAVNIAGNLTQNGTTFTAGSGVYTMTGTGKTISGTISIPSLTINGTCQNNGSLTVATALAGSSTLTQGVNSTLNIGGTSGMTTLTATANPNTVNYNGAAQTVKATAYNDLIFSGSGAKSMTSGTSVADNLSIAPAGGGATASIGGGLNLSANTLTLGGTQQAAGTWGGTGSGAANINPTYFAATTGILTVATGAGPTKLVYTVVPTTGTAGTAFSVTVQSQDAAGTPRNPTSSTTITLSKATGAGTLTGTLTGIIGTGANSVTISGVIYSKADVMTLTATATAGMTSLTPVTSGNITFSAGAAAATTVETAANGSGTTVGAQNITSGSSITVYAITRDANGNFVGNSTATWSLQSITGGVVAGDLVAGGASAVFTGHAVGSAIIRAVASTFTGNSGVQTVIVGAVNAGTSTVTGAPSSVVADGTTTSTVTVTLKDVNSNPVSGKSVTLAKSSGPGTPTITTVQGTTDASGVATFTVKSTTAGADVFQATDTTDSLVITQTATVTFTAGAVNAGVSTVSGSPTSVPADGATTSTITVTLKDVNSNPVSGKTVTLAKSSGPGTPTITTVQGTTDASGVATFTVRSTTAGADVFQATDTTDSLVITQTATVTFIGPVNASTSTVSASPTSVPADGATTSTITVTLKDVNSNPVSGKTVTLAKSSGPGTPTITTVQGTTDASGVATFTVRSTTAGADVFQATDTTDSLVVAQTATVTFTAVPTKLAFTSVPPTGTAGVAFTVTVQVQDAGGNPANVSSDTTITLSKASGAGTLSGTLTGTITAGNNSVTISTPVYSKADTLTLTATVSAGPALTPATSSGIVFSAGPVSASASTVTASPSSVPADGVTTSTITVTLTDANSNPVSGKTVTLASSRGATDTISTASGPSSASGVVTFTVKSSTGGTGVFTATDVTDSVVLTQTASVIFTTGPSAANSTVTASPTSVAADGVTTSTITVTLKNAANSPVAGKTVTLASSRGASDTISAASGPSDANGVVTFTVKSATVGTGVFTATDTTDAVVITQTASVTFVGSSAKDILTFGANYAGSVASIDNIALTVTWTLPSGTSLTSLSPTYTVSTFASGSPVSGTARNFTTPQSYTVTAQDGSTAVYVVSAFVAGAQNYGITRATDVAQEFSPLNKSGHPVITGLNNYSNSTAVGSPSLRGLQVAAMKAPWNSNVGTQTMMCSDCHDATTTNYVASAAQGPHGSAYQYMLRGPNAANWPNVTIANINTSWCANCHNNSAGAPHTQGNHSGYQCYQCHIIIPHGGKMSRLIGDRDTMPSRYAWQNNLSNMQIQSFTKKATTGYAQTGDCQASCYGSHSTAASENW